MRTPRSRAEIFNSSAADLVSRWMYMPPKTRQEAARKLIECSPKPYPEHVKALVRLMQMDGLVLA